MFVNNRVNIDFEYSILCNQTDMIKGLSDFMKVIYTTLKKLNPLYEVSFDTNSNPGNLK